MNILLLFAPPADGQGGSNPFVSIIMFGSIIAIFYFMILRPQKKRQKEREALVEAVKNGDAVVTSSGIHGVVTKVDDKTILLQIADNTKIKIEKSAIATVITN